MSDLPVIAEQWSKYLQQMNPEARKFLTSTVGKHGKEFVEKFYEVLLEDAEASAFFAKKEIIVRLQGALYLWISNLFSKLEPFEVESLIEEQLNIGTIHARMDVPMVLMLRGARAIKEALTLVLLAGSPTKTQVEALLASLTIMDFAEEIMAGQYSRARDAVARSSEAYRAFTIGMNMSLEREKQRCALGEWESRFLQTVLIGAAASVPPLGASSFGIWTRHKAQAFLSFGNELSEIERCINRVDEELLPVIKREVMLGEFRRQVQLVISETRQLRFLIDALFEHLLNMEKGKDPLTQLLSRRFQSTILTQEIAISRKSGRPFALLYVILHGLDENNKYYGEEVGDRLLQQVASLLSANVREGDFVFRHGGAEFLAVCVEVSINESLAFAEKISNALATTKVPASGEEEVSLDCTIGVALYESHPDYQQLIDHASAAARAAKLKGKRYLIYKPDIQA